MRWKPGKLPSTTISLSSLAVGKDSNNPINNRRKNVLLSSSSSSILSSFMGHGVSSSDDNDHDDVVLPMSLVRTWPEYSDIGKGDVIVTIEHCCKCWQHRDITRHNEEKYIEVRYFDYFDDYNS